MRFPTPKQRRPRPASMRTTGPAPANAAIRVVDLPDLIGEPPKRRVAAPAPIEPGPALRVVKPRRPLFGSNGRASWPVVAAIAGLTWVWLIGGVVAAWSLGHWLGTPEAAVPPAAAEPVVIAKTVEPTVAAQAGVKPAAPDPADASPGAAKAGPTPPPSLTPSQPPVAAASTDADTIAALLAKMPQQPAVCDPKGPKCVACGTAVNLIGDPELAAQEAVKEHKLLFVIHLAGNLEEARFT